MSQYYYILNSRPNKPNMRIEKPQHRTSFPCKFASKETVTKEEVKVEEVKEVIPTVEEAITATCEVAPEVVEQAVTAIEEVVEETPKKKRRGRKKAEEVEEETEA